MQPPALKTSHFGKFQLETLFYIFYNMPRDTLQAYAATELYNREWRYHKDLKLWFTRSSSQPGADDGCAPAARCARSRGGGCALRSLGSPGPPRRLTPAP
jgi:CCR4-NOT transcription complex subunit 2